MYAMHVFLNLLLCMYVGMYACIVLLQAFNLCTHVLIIFAGCMTAQVAFEVNYQNAQGIAPVQTAVVVNPAYITKN